MLFVGGQGGVVQKIDQQIHLERFGQKLKTVSV